MSRLSLRQALWVLAWCGMLAPTLADGNIGCLFSSQLCIEGVEWCYDDAAFGKCIPIYDDEPEDGSLYQYDMSNEQLQWFETELQNLVARGYRWDHAYTQCVLQAMLYTMRKKLDVTQVNSKICDHFSDPKLISESSVESATDEQDIDPDETAYIRFTPNNDATDTDFANEIYNPPVLDDDVDAQGPSYMINEPDDDSNDKIHDLMLLKEADDNVPIILPFGGFRERLQEEKFKPEVRMNMEKKSIPSAEELVEERLGAHYRKQNHKPIIPYTAEYFTTNRFSPLEDEMRMNAIEKYKQSFAEKNFPFEYVDTDIDMSEPRIYFNDDGPDNYPAEVGSGELHHKHNHEVNPGQMQEILKSLLDSKKHHQNYPQGAIYAEGGPLKPMDIQAKLMHGINKNKGEIEAFSPDPNYAYVRFDNNFGTKWQTGIEFMRKIEELLGLKKFTLTNPRVELNEVAFKVEKNQFNLDSADIARRIYDIRTDLYRATGGVIESTGIGNKIQQPIVRRADDPNLYFGLELPVLLALIGSLSVLVTGMIVFFVLLRKDMNSKKFGLSTAAEIDAEATKDYQELCRDRFSGKWSGPQPPSNPTEAQRIASLTREPNEKNSSSTRSSTSSWSEEPALTNMDISTGHMVLAYMEDHLRNKDRLEQEWSALCAYEAEPCATTAALKPENNGKNRYADVLPYDHSRVSLNTLSNHLGSDYINASTITDHDPRNPAYIAAAGPLAHTAPDFWQMVWEQGSVVTVMLTRLTENGQQLCHRYWPEEGSETYHIYEVHLVSEHIWCDDYLVRSFYLKNQRTGETRTVTQFHFLSWPENGVPVSTKALLEFRRKVNKSYRGRSCPIVVHCSDGAGRSGTYCLIDMVLNRMAKGAKEIDIAATLEHIRDQRPRTVATKQQFEFVLMAVAEEVHAILKALPAHLQQLQEKKDKEKDGSEKDKLT